MAAWGRGFPRVHPGMAFVVLAWSLNFSIVRLAYAEWTPGALMFARFLGTIPFMALVAMSSGAPLKAPARRWPLLLLAGMMSAGLYMVFFMEGMKRTGAAQGAVTLATAPIFIAAIGFFLGDEKPSWRWAVGSLVALAGVALTHLDGLMAGGGGLDGFLLVLASSVVWAIAVHLMRPLVAELGSVAAMALSLPGAFLVMIPYAGKSLVTFPYGSLTWVGWGTLAYLCVIAGSLAFVAYYRAVQDLGPASASMTQYIIPPAAALFAVILLGDELHPLAILGLVMALSGVALAQKRTAEPKEGKMEP